MRLIAVSSPLAEEVPDSGSPAYQARRTFRSAQPNAGFKDHKMEQKLKIAVFIDFDNIEIGVKSTLHREFDVAAVLDALKERGEIVTKFAYANWGRQESATRALSEYAVQMVQRDPSPRGDKNGADINLALDALEMAFTHDHINAYAIVSGDSDFIALVNKLKQYDKRIFVVGGRAFTSTILQKNCHEFVAYESIIDYPGSRPSSSHQPQAQGPQAQASAPQQQDKPHTDRPPQQQQQPRPTHKRVALDLAQSMPLVERALGVLERRGASAAWAAEIHHAATEFHVQRKGVRRGFVYGFRGEVAEGRFRGGDRRRRPLHDPHERRRQRAGETRAQTRGSHPAVARCAGNPSDRDGQRLHGRRAGRMGSPGAPQFRLARVRVPGVQRALELRAGQGFGAQPGGRGEGPDRLSGGRVPSAGGAAGAGTGSSNGRGRGGRTTASGAGPADGHGRDSAAGTAAQTATPAQSAAEDLRRQRRECQEAPVHFASAQEAARLTQGETLRRTPVRGVRTGADSLRYFHPAFDRGAGYSGKPRLGRLMAEPEETAHQGQPDHDYGSSRR